MQSDWLRVFSYKTWERDFPKTCGVCRIIKTTMVHDQPESGMEQMEQLLELQKALLLRIFQHFPQNKIFSWLYQFFVIKKPKICMKFHKDSISCFWEKVILINWLIGWQWCFHQTPFLPKGKGPTISTNQLIDMSNVV